ncbi:MAG: LapA family protein [Longimicrobiales bacterium]
MREDLTAARSRVDREVTWFLIGVTPATILPAGLAVAYGQTVLATAFVAGGFLLQTVRWFRAGRRVKSLERELAALEHDAGVGEQLPPPADP